MAREKRHIDASVLRKQMEVIPGVPSDVEVADMLEDVARSSNLLQDTYDCETTRAFANRDVAVAYATRVVIAMLATVHARCMTVNIISPDDSRNGPGLWAVLVDGPGVRYEDVACVASAVLASGNEAACGWCSHPTDAVEQVRAALRKHALVIYSMERTILAKVKTGATYTATFTRGWILQ